MNGALSAAELEKSFAELANQRSAFEPHLQNDKTEHSSRSQHRASPRARFCIVIAPVDKELLNTRFLDDFIDLDNTDTDGIRAGRGKEVGIFCWNVTSIHGSASSYLLRFVGRLTVSLATARRGHRWWVWERTSKGGRSIPVTAGLLLPSGSGHRPGLSSGSPTRCCEVVCPARRECPEVSSTCRRSR